MGATQLRLRFGSVIELPTKGTVSAKEGRLEQIRHEYGATNPRVISSAKDDLARGPHLSSSNHAHGRLAAYLALEAFVLSAEQRGKVLATKHS